MRQMLVGRELWRRRCASQTKDRPPVLVRCKMKKTGISEHTSEQQADFLQSCPTTLRSIFPHLTTAARLPYFLPCCFFM